MGYKSLLLLLAPACCGHSSDKATLQQQSEIDTADTGYAAVKNIPLPKGYTRLHTDTTAFAYWLRQAGLKKDKTVYLYNGQPKTNQHAQFAVLNISIGDKNLQQCADAVMRLRAEYLYQHKRYSEISFTDYGGTVYTYSPPYNRQRFTQYLYKVFGSCGTASLARQLRQKNIQLVEPGDVLIRGGFPGHAALVMDVAINAAGKRIFLLAQSYMPAQDIHILVNPANDTLSPWYAVSDDRYIQTPEYIFEKTELKCW
ncbi:MAG TPA: DUF4846 domain-containing protein [Ferruginibacter sp.]|nr:DUF4846 domain-containing protein [Ferruginibacter sp.]HMP21857.1 DUF4846 domain-containing protein [Ferruginibacter sp.]